MNIENTILNSVGHSLGNLSTHKIVDIVVLSSVWEVRHLVAHQIWISVGYAIKNIAIDSIRDFKSTNNQKKLLFKELIK